MAECTEHDSSSATRTDTCARLRKKLDELGNQKVVRKVASGNKKKDIAETKHRVAMMKRINEDKAAKVKELKDAADDLKRKVERARKINGLKGEDLEPVAHAIQRKRMTIDSLKNDPIYTVICFTSECIF